MRFKENIDSVETAEVESFTKAFQKTKKPSNLTYRNLVATKSEKPRASQTKWYRDCDLNEEEIDWKKTFQLTQEICGLFVLGCGSLLRLVLDLL